MRQVVILAGGAGTRLQERLGALPKPMIGISGKPLLEHQIELAKAHDFSEVVMLVSYCARAIMEHFGNGDLWDIKITYIEDSEPRGTAGATLDAFDILSDRFVVLYGDTMLNVDLDRLYRSHQDRTGEVTLFLHPNDHPHDSDLVEVDRNDRITDFHPYPHNPHIYYRNLVNAALYVIEKSSLQSYQNLKGIVDFGKDLFPQMLHDGVVLQGYRSPEYIKDVGTPDRLDRVQADIDSGVVERSSLAQMTPAVFLDRDGTLNQEVNRVSSIGELELISGVAKPLRRLNQSYYRTAIVTNQPIIARGDCSEAELDQIHNKLETLLGREGAYVDAIYYCPHHPDKGYEGEREEFKVTCECRKPKPGLIYRAANDLNIDIQCSWLIGDSTTDLMTARTAGLQSVLLRTGHAGSDKKYPIRSDFEFPDLSSAVNFILDEYPKLLARAQEIASGFSAGERVIVAGLAHTGKSTWSSVLKHAIEGRGRKCHIVALDNWLRSDVDRLPGGVLNRYDVPAIENFVARLSNADKTDTYPMPFYDRYKRKNHAIGDTLTIGLDDIVIFDGVIGLLTTGLLRYASRRLFIEGSEHTRRKNFWTEYRLRGLSDSDIQKLFDFREADETGAVLAAKSSADTIIEGHNV